VPVAGALVRLTSDASRTGLLPALERRTGPDGRFDFGVQIAREVEVGAAAPGRLAAVAHVDLRDPTVRPAPDALELALRGCQAAFYGTVTDAAGTPIAGAELLREDVIGTQTDAAGRYELCMLPVATTVEALRLVVRARGFGALALDSGLQGREHHDFVLTPEAVVDGRARTADGAPVAGARIWIEPADLDARRDSELAAPLVAVSEADGRFHFDGLTGGRHRVGGSGAGVVAEPIAVAVAAGAAREVALVVAPAAIVRGRVVHDGAPVAGARVAVAGGDGDVARSQADGSFVLGRVPIGAVQLVAAPYRVRDPAVVIVPGDHNQVTLEVDPLGRVTGVVRRHGQPVPDARVCAGRVPDGGAAPARNTCGNADATGRYELAGLAAGAYWMFADDAAVGAGVHDVRFQLAPAEQRALDVELGNGARVTGVVVDPADAPVAGVFLRFRAARHRDETRCVSGADGRFDCATLSPGSYEVVAFAGPDMSVPLKFHQAPPPIDLADGDSRVDGVRVVVDPTRLAIRGTIVDAAGAPVVDARVRALANAPESGMLSPFPSAASDGDGGFRIADLAPGNYALEVRTADGFRVLHPAVPAGSTDVRIVADAALCKNPQLAAASDPLRQAILHTEPTAMRARSPAPLIWDQRLQLLGWDIPDRIRFGQPFEVTLYYRVLAPIDRPWKVFVHFDGAAGRAGRGDHEPLAGRCDTLSWQTGDTIVDRFSVQIDASEPKRPPGQYAIWTGFFNGSAPRWRNLAVSDAPAAMRDGGDRIKIATVILE
jgi:hypothetical protein